MPDTPVGTNSPDYGPLTSADLGATIYCKVTATNASGTANADSNTVGPVAAGSGGWTPADLTGLLAWYKADAGVYSDTGTTPAAPDAEVKQWNDQSGGGRHLVCPTPSVNLLYKPTGFNTTHPCILNGYSGAEGLYTAPDTVPQGGTGVLSIWVVVRSDVDRTDNDVLASYAGMGLAITDAYTDAGSARLLMYATGNVGGYQGGGALAVTSVTVGTNYRIGSVFDGTNHEIYKNNVATGTPVANTNVFTSPGRLSVGTDGVAAWVGAIAEIVVTNTVLSSGDRTSLDNYFKAKWGLS